MAVAPLKSKILIIEDDPGVLNVMIYLLQRVGYEVAVATSGAAGIQLARHEEFDLVTVDVDLPDMSGFDVCLRLKQDFRFYRTPIIFVSGRLSEEDRRRGFEVGAADFITKPFDALTFTSRIVSRIRPVK